MSSDIFIVSAQRTAIGSFQGAYSKMPAPQLGAQAIQAAVSKAHIESADIDECIMGQVLTAGAGQAPARQAALSAGLPTSVTCMTINKVCGSGLKAVMLAADSLRLGSSQICVAGGQENMTLAPHLLEASRAGYRMGPVTSADSMIKDGLWDPYNNYHMGNAAELCVREYKTSREEQDAFAKNSYEKAQKAMASGAFNQEIFAVEIDDRGTKTSVSVDEEPGKARFDKIPSLKPAFEKTGTITAANASKINDGAAALIVANEAGLKKKNLKPMARIVSYSTFAQDPKWFTTAPVGAMKKAADQAGLKFSDIDLFEINEAFSVVTMVAIKELGLDPLKVNVEGGAVALGHPIGASGARLLTTLVHSLHHRNLKRGMVSLCIGGGEAVAMVVERV